MTSYWKWDERGVDIQRDSGSGLEGITYDTRESVFYVSKEKPKR